MSDLVEEQQGHAISVVIPTHDRAQWLAAAIRSTLKSPLIEPNRVIVADDDSQDNTEEVARSYGVTYLRNRLDVAKLATPQRVRTRCASW
jgi:glycosyltransferase involved in cell wall biosynthesis